MELSTQGLAGELVNVLKEAGQIVPEALLKIRYPCKEKGIYDLGFGRWLLANCLLEHILAFPCITM